MDQVTTPRLGLVPRQAVAHGQSMRRGAPLLMSLGLLLAGCSSSLLTPSPSSIGSTPSPPPSIPASMLPAPPSPSPTSSATGAPSRSPAATFSFTLQRSQMYPLPVRVFDRTGRLIAARESTSEEVSTFTTLISPELLAGPAPDMRIATWMGGACDASADVTVGPSVDQVSVQTTQTSLPSPSDGVVYACPAVRVIRYVTLTFADASSSEPTPAATPTPAPLPANSILVRMRFADGTPAVDAEAWATTVGKYCG